MSGTTTVIINNGYHWQQTPFYCVPASIEMVFDSSNQDAGGLTVFTDNVTPLMNGNPSGTWTSWNGDFGLQDGYYLQAWNNNIATYNAEYDLSLGLTTTPEETPPDQAIAVLNEQAAVTGLAGDNFVDVQSGTEAPADRAIAVSLATTLTPAIAIVAGSRHAIDVYGFNAVGPVSGTSIFSVTGFYIHDPWTGFWAENSGAAHGITGYGLSTYMAVGGAWSAAFAPDLFLDYQAVVNQPPTALTSSAATTADAASPGQAEIARATAAGTDSAATITNAAEAVAAAMSDLSGNASIAAEAGFKNGGFDVSNTTEMAMSYQSGGDEDWVVPYDGASGTNDVTGALWIDNSSGNLDQATWFNPTDVISKLTLAQLTLMATDEAQGLLPDDNVIAAAAASAALPDVSASFTSAAYSAMQSALAALIPTGTTPDVVSVSAGGSVAAATSGLLNAEVVTTAGAGTTVTVPSGYAAAYVLAGTPVLKDTNGGAILIDATSNATLIGGANDSLFGGNGNETLVAGGGAETLDGGTGNNLFELASSTVTAISQGTDTIVGASGSATVNASGTPLFFGGSDTTVFDAAGSSATLVGGGSETVNASASNVLLFAGAGALDFNAGSGASTVVSGTAGATVTGGSTGLLYFATGPTDYIAGSAVDTVIGFTGTLTASGGANGTLFFTGTGGANNVSTGTGSSTIVGFGTGDSLSATAAGSDVIEAAAASETISATAASGTNTFFAFGQNDVVLAGAGSTAVQSYVGSQTLSAGTGADLFAIVESGQRAVTFVNFTQGQDFVQLQGYAAGTGAAALPSAVISGGGEVLTLPDGTTLTFQGVTGLTASSFV